VAAYVSYSIAIKQIEPLESDKALFIPPTLKTAAIIILLGI